MENIETRVLVFFEKWHLSSKKGFDTVINSVFLSQDDAIMIFEDFLMEFKIELGYTSFDVDKYFYKISILDTILYYFLKKNFEKKYKKKPPITIRHMIEVAKKREWFDPLPLVL